RALLLLLLATPGRLALADEKKPDPISHVPVAILPIQDRGDEVKGLGVQASDLLFANLSKEASLWLVDREDLRATLSEQELNMSGVVNPQQAVKIGQITGAKIILTGSVFQTGNSLYLVAKVIGTETTRVLGVSAKGAVADGIDTIAKTAAAD